MALTMEQYGRNFVKTGESLEDESSEKLHGVVDEGRQEMADNLEAGRKGTGSPMEPLAPLTLEIRKGQGISGKKPGQAGRRMLRSMRDKSAVIRIGKFTFQIRPRSDKELEKMEFFINPGSQTVTKKQAGKLYALTGKKAFVPPGSKIKKPARNFKLPEKRIVHYQERGAELVGNVILEGIGATTDAPTFQGRSSKSRRK